MLKEARYCANTSQSLKKASDKRKVHDLENEKTQCQIDKIRGAGHTKWYDSLSEAYRDGYANCHWCLGVAMSGRRGGRRGVTS